MKRWLATGMLFLALLSPSDAAAEQDEIMLGVEGGVVLPSFESFDKSAFALATWFFGVSASYGFLDDMAVEMSADLSSFDGQLEGHERPHLGRILSGDLIFSSTHVELSALVRYNLYAGYSFTPYLEAGIGGLFSSYRDQRLLTEGGLDYGLTIDDAFEFGLATTLGAAVDLRLFELLLLRLSFGGAKVFGDVRWSHSLHASFDVVLSL